MDIAVSPCQPGDFLPVTDAVGSHPALASLVLATATGDNAATAAPSATPAAASRDGSTGDALRLPGFSALLQGLQAPAPAASPAAAVPAATAAFAAAPVADADAAAAMQAGSSLAATDQATLAALSPTATSSLRDGKAAGEDSPAGGTDLPPADDAGLLASLLPGDASLAAPPAIPPTPAPATGATAVTVTPDGSATGATATAITPGAAAGATVAAAASATMPTMDADADAAPGDVAAGSGPTIASASDPSSQPVDAQLPDAFRARLDAALAELAQSAPRSHDPGTGAGPLAAATALTATGTGHVPSAATSTMDATGASLPDLRPAGDREAWAQGLGERLLMMADRGLQSATLRLQPEHLGPMEIRISVQDDGSAQVLFSAHHGQTRDALEAAIPRLRDLFAEQGLSLTQANVDSGRGQSFAERGFGADTAGASQRGAGSEASAPAEEPTAWRVLRAPQRRLDVMA